MTLVPDELIQATAMIVYACRPWTNESAGQRRLCEHCERAIAVTPSVLAEKRAHARLLGRELEVVCDGCAETALAAATVGVVAMPGELELAEAARLEAQR